MQNKRTKNLKKKQHKIREKMREWEREKSVRENTKRNWNLQSSNRGPCEGQTRRWRLNKTDIFIQAHTLRTTYYICIYPIYMCMQPPHRTDLRVMHWVSACMCACAYVCVCVLVYFLQHSKKTKMSFYSKLFFFGILQIRGYLEVD